MCWFDKERRNKLTVAGDQKYKKIGTSYTFNEVVSEASSYLFLGLVTYPQKNNKFCSSF